MKQSLEELILKLDQYGKVSIWRCANSRTSPNFHTGWYCKVEFRTITGVELKAESPYMTGLTLYQACEHCLSKCIEIVHSMKSQYEQLLKLENNND